MGNKNSIKRPPLLGDCGHLFGDLYESFPIVAMNLCEVASKHLTDSVGFTLQIINHQGIKK